MASDALQDFLASGKAYVFPVQPMGKLPATKHGWREATNDPAKIAEWKRINPDFNWGLACGMSGVMVFDIDPAGLDYWAKLLERDEAIRGAVDKAFQVRTPRGGLHVYFVGEGPSTASRIAEGIDTRGGIKRPDGSIQSGGYVLLPGSKTDKGAYSVLPGGDILPIPVFISEIIPARKKTDTLGLEKNPDKDLPRNIKTAEDLIDSYVKSGRVSIEGNGGNTLAWSVAASIMDKAISPGACFDLLWSKWNEHCQPPWDDWELETIVRNAWEHGEDTQSGVKGHQSNADAFAKFVGMETPVEAPTVEERNRIRLIHEYADSVGDPKWLIPNMLPAEGVGVLYGESGSFKSFLALDWACCISHGVPGQWGIPEDQGIKDVLYFAGEAPKGMSRMRWPAWQTAHDIEFRTDHRLFFFDRIPYRTDEASWENVKKDLALLGCKPSMIVIDTLSRLMTGEDENDTKNAVLVVSWAEELARYYECFVLLVHHEGKDKNRGARGSIVFTQNPDFVGIMRKAEKGTTLRVTKQKDIDESDEVFYMKVTPSSHNSIVLKRSNDMPGDDPKPGAPKHSWAERAAICETLKGLGGSAGTMVLAQQIDSEIHIGKQKVASILKKAPHLGFLRDGDMWYLPEGDEEIVEYDL